MAHKHSHHILSSTAEKKAICNFFNEFLEDISEDELRKEATGFKDSAIWQKFYSFQRDAALAIINKLEKNNGWPTAFPSAKTSPSVPLFVILQ
jgi:hypothetical protein